MIKLIVLAIELFLSIIGGFVLMIVFFLASCFDRDIMSSVMNNECSMSEAFDEAGKRKNMNIKWFTIKWLIAFSSIIFTVLQYVF